MLLKSDSLPAFDYIIRYEIGGYIFFISLIMTIFTYCLVDKNNFYICRTPPVKLMWVFSYWVPERDILLCSMFSITSTDNPMCPQPHSLLAHIFLSFFI